ncbi:MAG: hypothetical protein OXB86_02155 [Bdellovibrionales bacterium]|nr:hypothetical protein [Bdellovibrionales bacterium]
MKEKVRKKVITGVKKKIDQKIPEIVKETDKKTILYALWSLAGLLLISINFPKAVFYVFSFLMILTAVYFLVGFIQSLRKFFSFINNFDQEIKKIVEKRIELVEENSDKDETDLWNKIKKTAKKAALRFSGYDQKDIEDLCIAYFVRELAKRFKKYKRYILIKVVAYTIAVLLFKEVLFSFF